MSKELQRDEFILPGDLGEMTIASTGKKSKVTQMSVNRKDGSMTFTLTPIANNPETEDVDCEIIPPKQIEQN